MRAITLRVMAIYHLSAKMIKRSAGRSATAAAAYRAGAKITDRRTGVIHDYRRRDGVAATEIFAPRSAPEFVMNRDELWNQAELAGKRKDSQTAREIEVALPRELDLKQQKALLHDFVTQRLVSLGMVADVAIHHPPGNPHAHILLTTRDLTANGFGQINRAWAQKDLLCELREGWALDANRHLRLAGVESRIDHRSLEDQGSDAIPTIHHGNKPDLVARNDEIIRINQELAEAIQSRSQIVSAVPAAEPPESFTDALERYSAHIDDLDPPADPSPSKRPKGPSM